MRLQIAGGDTTEDIYNTRTHSVLLISDPGIQSPQESTAAIALVWCETSKLVVWSCDFTLVSHGLQTKTNCNYFEWNDVFAGIDILLLLEQIIQ